jgi:hypothetical protein
MYGRQKAVKRLLFFLGHPVFEELIGILMAEVFLEIQ